MLRPQVDPTPRKRLTPAQKVEILARQEDRCPVCSDTLVWQVIDGRKVYGPMIDEHWDPLFFGREDANDLSNRKLLCVRCAKVKTRQDQADIGHVRRLIKKADPEARRSMRPIKGRGFDKRLTKHMDGTVTRRNGL